MGLAHKCDRPRIRTDFHGLGAKTSDWAIRKDGCVKVVGMRDFLLKMNFIFKMADAILTRS